jgi:flagellar biosynthetic protein FliP
MVDIAKSQTPETKEELSTLTLIPAFILSELRRAFQIGFMIFIPFLIIDMITASVLMTMGMLMLPPIVISLPFKVLLFVLVDGWNLIVGSLMQGFY